MGTARRRVAVTTALAAVSLTALATGLVGSGQQARATGLQPFDSCAELGRWFRDQALEVVGPWGLGGHFAIAADMAGGAPVSRTGAESASGATGGPVGPGATGTNVQERGVDEPDVAKVLDGLLVTVQGDRLYTVDVRGRDPRALGDVRIPGAATELLLVGDRALVLGGSWDHGPVPLAERDVARSVMPPHALGTTVLTVVDLGDPRDPTVVRSTEVEGRYLSARESDGVVRLVVSSTPTLPFVTPDRFVTGDNWAAAEARALRRNRALVREAKGTDWLPRVVERDATGRAERGEPLLGCSDVTHPADPAGLAVLTVLTIDLTKPSAPTTGTTGVAADGDLVYASTDRLYVATTRGGWVRPAMDGRPGRTTTGLHGFDTTATEDVEYLASGEVEGWLLGRWALSAQDGYLRVATTRDRSGEGRTDSAVVVLDERGGELVRVGRVGGLGKGEQIRAVRWFGDLAVVVTFRQTDPLYTLDLSDPADPAVVGELKVPGYSAYLHPLGDDLLLGVGQDADVKTGATRGGQVATYDLRDLSAPEQVDVLIDRQAWWDVEGDSRAFNYLPSSRTALLSGQHAAKGSVLTAVRVREDGTLRHAGRFSPGRDAWLVRAVPVGEDRVAAVVTAGDGPRVVLLDAETLERLGATRLS